MKAREKHLSHFYVQNFFILVTDQLHAYSIIILTYLNLGTDQEISIFIPTLQEVLKANVKVLP